MSMAIQSFFYEEYKELIFLPDSLLVQANVKDVAGEKTPTVHRTSAAPVPLQADV